MDLYYCEPVNCDKKDKCNRYLVKYNKFYAQKEKIGEDLSDICKGQRLFLPGDKYKNFRPKQYYVDLLYFFDNVCEGNNCISCEVYKKEPLPSSRVPCKKGVNFTCNHESHPDNKIISDAIIFMKVVNESFKKVGLEFGEVTFKCPICGGEAWAARYNTPGNISHKVTVRSYCKKCGCSMMN